MPAYLVVHVDVTDPKAYAEYARYTPHIINKFGGRFIVRGGEATTLEGPTKTHRLVIIEFPTVDQAKGFYNSDEYQRVKQIRNGAGEVHFIVVDGYPTEAWELALQESKQLRGDS